MRLYLNNLQGLGVSLALLAGLGIVHAQQPAADQAAKNPAASAEKAQVVPASTAKTSKKSGTSHAKSSAKTGTTAGKTHASSSGKTQTSARRRRGGSRKGAWKRKGQQVILPERAREIQEALIREHYLSGEANGKWDARTEAAMVKYQADNGWQSKVTPDSRALIKLGLGPNYSKEKMLNQPNKADAVASAGGADK